MQFMQKLLKLQKDFLAQFVALNPFSTDGTLKYRSIKMLLLIFCIDLLEILVKSFFYNI